VPIPKHNQIVNLPGGIVVRTNTLSFVIGIAIACVATFLSPTARAQNASDVVGTWTLVSSVAEKDGTRTDQFGSGAKGMMTLDADGHFMLTIIGPDLPKFASNNRAGGTPDENSAVVSKSIAMIGTYSVNLADKTLVFKVDSATFPNWNGTEQRRLLLSGNRDELKYITPTASSGGVGTVTWTRAK
jgi:Lipocalin-like domain